MRGRVFLGVMTFAVPLTAQQRDPNFVEEAVARGVEWHCAVAGRLGVCARSARACEVVRQQLADEGRSARCVQQRAAFCTTWRTADGVDSHCSPSPAACEAIRRTYFQRNRAAAVLEIGARRSQISRCERVGELIAPAPEPPRTTLPPGVAPPEAPSRDDVMAALRWVRGGVQACDGAPRPVLQLTVVFGADGRVRQVDFGGLGSEMSTAYARCVDAAVRRAAVPPFRRDHFSVQYPFSTVRD